MRTLRNPGSVSSISRSSHISEADQLNDQISSIQSAISEIVSEWNSEVQPILNSLPQGKSETRWDFTTDDIFPKRNGLDGTQLFVDNSASLSTNGGRYWDSVRLRPKTLKESMEYLHQQILNRVDTIQADVSSISSSGISASAKERIGANVFDSSVSSSSTSIDTVTTNNEVHLIQLARDIYSDSYDSWTSDGTGLLDKAAIRDMLAAVLELHGSSWNSTTSPTHDTATGFGTAYSSFAAALNEETTSTSEVVIGGLVYDPSQNGSTSNVDILFNVVGRYVAAGAAGSAEIRLYDLGAPGSTGAGTLRSTITQSYTGATIDSQTNSLTVSSSPGVNTNQIYSTARVYEIRMILDGTGDPSDASRVNWAGILTQPTSS